MSNSAFLHWTNLIIDGFMVIRMYSNWFTKNIEFHYAQQSNLATWLGSDFATSPKWGKEHLPYIFATANEAQAAIDNMKDWYWKNNGYSFMVVPAVYAVHTRDSVVVSKTLVLPGADFKAIGGRAVGHSYDHEEARKAEPSQRHCHEIPFEERSLTAQASCGSYFDRF